MTLIAKPVVDKKYWILKHNDIKVGNVEQTDSGKFVLTVRGKTSAGFETLKNLQAAGVEFATLPKKSKPNRHQVHGYETGCRVFNPVWDVKRKLPLFTKKETSKVLSKKDAKNGATISTNIKFLYFRALKAM